jgi:hypothetical protein
MSQQHSPISSRIFCAFLASLGGIFFATALFAQVPTNVPHSRNLAAAESSIPTGRTVVKVMLPEAPIPFNSVQGARSIAILDMTGNDQEYVRKFNFRNTSSASYTINSIDFEKHDNMFEFMSVEPYESLPIVVLPGQTFTVRIAFHAVQLNLLCSNKLIFKTAQSKEPVSYPIQAKQQSWMSMPWNEETAYLPN